MKILLVEDEFDVGSAIHRTLKQEKFIIDWVQNGEEAWYYLQEPLSQYTIAILDWMLPGLTGLELCQRLRARQNAIPILMLTARDRWEDKVLGLDAGADDYLIKPFRMEELLARLRALLRRAPQFQSQQLQVGPLVLSYSDRSLTYTVPDEPPRSTRLSKKEFQLLEYFMKHPKQSMSRERILNYLYELDAERVSNVVAAQVRLLRKRLAEIGCSDLIETISGGSYRINQRYAN
ncbi:MAG TPA: DNA-binding response regulator [Cyanobacteria bacterium UBA11149]|nr:DNA-binding response regulator [Cyanobacteria bacterium UBA11367]HBE60348.1 DNA-binding response regulator [Cyanobacteria bacterium UBA11366]HBK66640.1 DNA-binding response regulator [Cyanobacteria bacterium UBA11166]HBR75410.1 DNA-binding response regulator [Cyanobacteria bacterium UBA11159]HBS71854.1 DNA-binding response regulator [Cyanobacteria bacterium UBA11153]HBW89674.1 DNA-binding response regulator [Cyanobacteria bacterium UBA11149]HCA97048.1 DNA-binding response regulator [Cyanob